MTVLKVMIIQMMNTVVIVVECENEIEKDSYLPSSGTILLKV